MLASFATVAALSPVEYTRPIIHPNDHKSCIKLSQARHPCVELMDEVSFIANDYDLVQDESSYQIITGPNMVS